MGIKGNVYSVENYIVETKMRFGEEITKGEYWDATMIFDDKGKLNKTIKCRINGRRGSNEPMDSVIVVYNWDGDYKLEFYDGYYHIIEYNFDDHGNLIEYGEKTFYSERGASPREETKYFFSPILNGYEYTYYPDPSSKGMKYRVTNNQISEKTSSHTAKNTYSADGKILKESKSITGTTENITYQYNRHDDLESITETIQLQPGRTPSTKKRNWSYEYDDQGNWISRKGDDGWIKRKITYMKPSEIREAQAKELQARLQFRDSLISEREREIIHGLDYKFNYEVSQSINNFANCLSPMAIGYDVNFKATPIVNATRNGNQYSFDFADGTQFNNVSFEPIGDGFYSKDHDLVMVYKEYFDGHEHPTFVWYVGRFAGEPYKRYKEIEAEALTLDEYIDNLKNWNYQESLEPPYKYTKLVTNESNLPNCHVEEYYYIPIELNPLLQFPAGMNQEEIKRLSPILAKQNEILKTKRMIQNAMAFCRLTEAEKIGIADKIKKLSVSKKSDSYDKRFDIVLKSGRKYTDVKFHLSEYGTYFSEDNRLMLFSNGSSIENNGNLKEVFIIVEFENGTPCSANYIIQNVNNNKCLLPQGSVIKRF